MSGWLRRIAAEPDNMEIILSALEHFETKLGEGFANLKPEGRVWDKCTMIPGLQAYWIGQWQELRAILEHLEIRSKRFYMEAYKGYLTSYKGRELNDAQARRFADGDKTVLDIHELMVEFKLLVSKFEALTTGLQSLHFQLSNLVKLKAEGIEDAMF